MADDRFESEAESTEPGLDTPEAAPTAAELLAETALLGAMLAEAWWRAAGRVTEVAVVEPARIASHLAALTATRIGGSTLPAAGRIGEVALPAASRLGEAAPRRGGGTSHGAGKERLRGSPRERGAELLRRSADIAYEQEQHPAHLRILDQIAPDEARILRLLVTEGPQPVVDVRAGLPGFDRGIRSSLSMIGATAGCRYPERSGLYLNNLVRLGLAAISPDPVPDPGRYQLLEAQPDVIEARKQAGRLGRTVRRSLILTPFGHDFCIHCLPLDSEAG